MTESASARLEALITIVDFSLAKVLNKIFKKNKAPLFFLTHGHGTAKSVIYDILGYGEPKKIIAVSIQTPNMAGYLLRHLQKELEFNKPGTGIAFTISLSGASKALLTICQQAEEILRIGSEQMPCQIKEPYHLIITILNSGNLEKMMDIAKAAGATGGTSIHGRGLGSKEAMKYLGITIHPEKELVLILAKQQDKLAIMESITSGLGIHTPGGGICFSLPVSDALGLDLNPGIREF